MRVNPQVERVWPGGRLTCDTVYTPSISRAAKKRTSIVIVTRLSHARPLGFRRYEPLRERLWHIIYAHKQQTHSARTVYLAGICSLFFLARGPG